jgi:hypothetical protein
MKSFSFTTIAAGVLFLGVFQNSVHTCFAQTQPYGGADAQDFVIGSITPVTFEVLFNDRVTSPSGSGPAFIDSVDTTGLICGTVVETAASPREKLTFDPTMGTPCSSLSLKNGDTTTVTYFFQDTAVGNQATPTSGSGIVVTITFTGPTLGADFFDIQAGDTALKTYTVLANDKKDDGTTTPTVIASVSAAGCGTAAANGANNAIEYTNDAACTGSTTLTYTFTDNSGPSAAITVTINFVVPSAPTPRFPFPTNAEIQGLTTGFLATKLAANPGFNFPVPVPGAAPAPFTTFTTWDKATTPAFTIGQATGAQDNLFAQTGIIFESSGFFPEGFKPFDFSNFFKP